MAFPQKFLSPAPGSSPGPTPSDDLAESFHTPQSERSATNAVSHNSGDDIGSPSPATRMLQVRSPTQTKETLGPAESSEDEDEDDDDVQAVPLPRGRLAARLQGANTTVNQLPESSAVGETAYERLKRELAQEKQEQSKSTESQPNMDKDDDDDDDDEPVSRPAPMRRMLFTKKRPDAPSSRPSTANSDSEQPHRSVPATRTRDNDPVSTSSSRAPTSRDAIPPSDSDSAPPKYRNESHEARVAKKRAEREQREAEHELERQRRREQMERSSDKLEEMIDEDADADNEDVQGGKKLSSQAKPTRKASKKAVEAMNRETQRMSRNMQLAHAATTRKKITKESLFAKFNFRQPAATSANAREDAASSLPGTSQPPSDAEQGQEHHTPPTSPASPAGSHNKSALGPVSQDTQLASLPLDAASDTNVDCAQPDAELPSLEELLEAPLPRQQPKPLSAKAQGKQKADPLLPLETYRSPPPAKPAPARIQNFRVRIPVTTSVTLSDDEDLEIAPAKPLSAKFDAILAKAHKARDESNNKIKFRALAHITSPSKRDKRYTKPSVPVSQMQHDLMRKAREQIAREREERLNELKARGIIIQTAEERERDQMVTEDLLEKARKEVEELTKKEKAERKKEGGGAEDPMDVDESDDESYVASGGEQDDDADADDEEELIEPELSGSEEEDEEIEDVDEDEGTFHAQTGLFDDEADEEDEENENVSMHDEEEHHHQLIEEVNVDPVPQATPIRRNRVKRVIDDDEDEVEENQPIAAIVPESVPASPAVVNPFGPAAVMNPFGAAPMGLTQAFAATMENSQVDDDSFTQESSAVVFQVPEPNLPVVDQVSISAEQGLFVLKSPEPILTSLPPTQYTQRTAMTQDFEMPEPTQDGGFIATSPIAQRFASVPPSTVDTVLVHNAQAAEVVNPDLKRKGRLLRRSDMDRVSEDEVETPIHSTQPSKAVDAFTAMKKAERRRQRMEEFNKKKSAAKDIVDEQAEESEDEYAGLGGASDDESGGEMDEEVKKMLDDETQLDLNESQLAAFHADKERISNEKDIEKLYKDIANGGLRRKRGHGDFSDLDDSDDEAERRQRLKRLENARMRRALLADENVGKIAENPKKAAFLKALEDRDDADDFDGMLNEPESVQGLVREDSIQEVPNSQPAPQIGEGQNTAEKRKRPLEETDPNKRLPPNLRRTKPHADAVKKPATLAEIRESVSFLVEDSRGTDILVPATQSDESDNEEDSFSSSRFAARRAANPVVDRLSLKRAESANSNGSGGSGRAAFFTKGRDEQGFRVPSLLKKATTMSASGEVTYLTERATGRKEGEVKKGGTKKSSVAHFAREAERRKAVDKVEKRKEAERKKAVEGRRGLLKGLGAGKFE